MKYGYARVSHTDQNLGTQIEQLQSYGVNEILQETITGVAKEKKLNELVSILQPGDSLIVTRMDRLGRNASQLFSMVEQLAERGVNLVILDLNVDTGSKMGKFFLQIMAAYAELDRATIKEKQQAGIALAKKKGVQLGRPRKYSDRDPGIKHALELYDKKEHTVPEICAITKISKPTLYRFLNKKMV